MRGIAWVLFGMLLLANADAVWLPVINPPTNIFKLVGLIIALIGLVLATFFPGGDEE